MQTSSCQMPNGIAKERSAWILFKFSGIRHSSMLFSRTEHEGHKSVTKSVTFRRKKQKKKERGQRDRERVWNSSGLERERGERCRNGVEMVALSGGFDESAPW